MQLELIGKKIEASDVFSFSFKSKETFPWKPGQYLRYNIPHAHPDERGESRYFTIASAPFEGEVKLVCRIPPPPQRDPAQAGETEDSTFKLALKNLPVGSVIEATGPKGAFVVEDPALSYVFIAGGIGITPFRAILLDFSHKGSEMNITLLYANRTNDIVFKSEFDDLTVKHPFFKVHYIVDPERINEGSIHHYVSDLSVPYFYVSGPEPMVIAMEEVLEKMGVQKEKIRHDYFPGYISI